MSATAIIGDFAQLTKTSKDTISLKPNNSYSGTELNDERLRKLYAMYCCLIVEQYSDNCKETV